MNLEKNAPYLAMALIAITLIFSQIGIFDEKYNLDLNLLIQESENDAFIELNEYSLSKNPRLQLSVINSSTDECISFFSSDPLIKYLSARNTIALFIFSLFF